jgi:hypothetical protein
MTNTARAFPIASRAITVITQRTEVTSGRLSAGFHKLAKGLDRLNP